jgi:MFS family permease
VVGKLLRDSPKMMRSKREAERKRIYLVLFVAIFAAMLGIGLIAPLMPLYAQSLGATGIWLGVIFAGFSLSRAVFMPIIGRISDRTGRKIFISIGLFAYIIISIAYTLAHTVSQLVLVRLLNGFAAALVFPVAMAYVGEISPRGNEGSYLGTFNVSLFLGMGLGPFVGGTLSDRFNMAAPFYAMAGLTAIGFILVLCWLPELDLHKKRLRENVASYQKMLQNNTVKGLFIFRATAAFGRGIVMPFLPIFAYSIGVSLSAIGILLAIFILLTAISQIPFGFLADRFSRIKLMIIGSLASSFVFFLIPISHNFGGLLLLCVTMGLFGAIGMPAGTALTVQLGRGFHSMGSMMGLFNMAMSCGMVAGPLVGGACEDMTGLPSVFYLGGAIGVIGTGIFWRFIVGGEGPLPAKEASG